MNTLLIQTRKNLLMGLLLLILFPLLFINFNLYSTPTPRYAKELSNLAHVPLFALISYWVWYWIEHWSGRQASSSVTSTRRIFILWLLVCITIALITEQLQTLTGTRYASWTDIRRDCLGLTLFLAAYPALANIGLPGRRLLATVAITWLLIELIPLGIYSRDYYAILRHPDILADFDTIGQRSRWNRGELVATSDSDGQSALKIKLGTELYSGTSLEYLPRNWNDWTTFHLEVFCADSTPQSLHFKIDDSQAITDGNSYLMRFNATEHLQSGWNSIDIPIEAIRNGPADRKMDMAQIYSVTLFFSHRTAPGFMLLDNLRLR
ncbi:MAG: hypothetical protein DRQ52_07830 [Gammaproteobacteria bacterium]|nr:MAG: hypothetical protein DRQ52_07830 [Gammaproteobacteria bacterium]